MDFEKDNFEDDNELSRLDDEELAGETEEIVETEEEELVIVGEEPEEEAPAAKPAPKPAAKKPAKKAAKKKTFFFLRNRPSQSGISRALLGSQIERRASRFGKGAPW